MNKPVPLDYESPTHRPRFAWVPTLGRVAKVIAVTTALIVLAFFLEFWIETLARRALEAGRQRARAVATLKSSSDPSMLSGKLGFGGILTVRDGSWLAIYYSVGRNRKGLCLGRDSNGQWYESETSIYPIAVYERDKRRLGNVHLATAGDETSKEAFLRRAGNQQYWDIEHAGSLSAAQPILQKLGLRTIPIP